jgi:hypothetical protein
VGSATSFSDREGCKNVNRLRILQICLKPRKHALINELRTSKFEGMLGGTEAVVEKAIRDNMP